MGGGAWPFLVGGVICLVNSVNERCACPIRAVYWWRYFTEIAFPIRGAPQFQRSFVSSWWRRNCFGGYRSWVSVSGWRYREG